MEINILKKICAAVMAHGSPNKWLAVYTVIWEKKLLLTYVPLVNAIIGSLKNPNENAREGAKELLQKVVNEPVIEAICHAIENDMDIQDVLVGILLQIDDSVTIKNGKLREKMLISAVKYGNAAARWEAVSRIGKMIKNSAAVEPDDTINKEIETNNIEKAVIDAFINDVDIEVCKAAAGVLACIGTEHSAQALIKGMFRKGVDVSAVEALGKCKGYCMLLDKNLGVIARSWSFKGDLRVAAIHALAERSKNLGGIYFEEFEQLMQAVDSYNSDVVFEAVKALGSVEIKEKGLFEQMLEMKYNALMGILKDNKIHALKYRIGEAKREKVRAVAACSLAEIFVQWRSAIGTEKVDEYSNEPACPVINVPAELADMLEDMKKPVIQAGIIGALGIIGKDRCEDYENLVNKYLDVDENPGVDLAVCIAAANALGESLGENTKTKELLFTMRDKSLPVVSAEEEQMVNAAEKALERIARREWKKGREQSAGVIIVRLRHYKISDKEALKSL